MRAGVGGRLLPAELAPDLLESYLAQHAAPNRRIYSAVLMLLAGGAVAAPLTYVDVSVQANGIIRPAADKHDVRAATSALVDRVLVRDGERVAAGQAIALLRPGGATPRAELVAARLSAAERAVRDLDVLTSAPAGSEAPRRPRTPRYREELARYLGALRESELRRAAAQRSADRTRALLERRFATPGELENDELRLAQADAELASTRERQLSEWHAQLAAERTTVATLRADARQLADERARLVIRAPVAGTVEQLARVAGGSFVQSGDVVAVVSPDLRPVAEVYVAPRDVAFLRVGAAARFQVDAFNHRDWGLARGRIAAISADYVQVDDRPMFKVRCALETPVLALRNGVAGRISKGMTVRARFPLARRNVVQLVRDDVSDWLDPTRAPG